MQFIFYRTSKLYETEVLEFNTIEDFFAWVQAQEYQVITRFPKLNGENIKGALAVLELYDAPREKEPVVYPSPLCQTMTQTFD